ncbi:glycosyltransferase [Pseudarthrobacter oxydans]|uniref:glycosyltransferase n=1 Tax=Pseudarthrobacter oxydans TaxID=1671 RepID=UPI00382C84DA
MIIYDPNWINPYGVELAAIIAASNFEVSLWCTENRVQAPAGVKMLSKLLPGRRKSLSLPKLLLRRLLEPLAVAGSAPRNVPLILVWTRDPWDAFVFLTRATLGGRTIFVYHNPTSVRDRGGLSGLMERLILRVSTVSIVHSSRLAAAADAPKRRVQVAAHPPYGFTTRGTEPHSLPLDQSGSGPVVAFLGALRQDKGVGDLVKIAKQIDAKWTLRILGPDRLSDDVEAALQESSVTTEYVGSGAGPTDDQLITGLKSADVMIAPYRSVTESGSVHMALSLKVPVLAYESPGLSHIVNEQSMAPTPLAFADLLTRYFQDPWPTYTGQAFNLHEQCTEDWRRVLDSSS